MSQSTPDRIHIEAISVSCIIGIFEWERKTPQTVTIDLTLPADARNARRRDHIEDTLDYKKVSKAVIEYVSKSSFRLLESLAEEIAKLCIVRFELSFARVHVRKPGALRDAKDVGIALERASYDYPETCPHTVHLSLGSNIEPEKHMPLAIEKLSQRMRLHRISQIYETAPFGSADGKNFWNAAVEARTPLAPDALLEFIRKVEASEGRVRTGDKCAPRTIDIDVVFYDGKFTGPEESAGQFARQGFIVMPLAEIAPQLKDPLSGKTLMELLAQKTFPGQPMRPFAVDSAIFLDQSSAVDRQQRARDVARFS